jgi:hypothetical protein
MGMHKLDFLKRRLLRLSRTCSALEQLESSALDPRKPAAAKVQPAGSWEAFYRLRFLSPVAALSPIPCQISSPRRARK